MFIHDGSSDVALRWRGARIVSLTTARACDTVCLPAYLAPPLLSRGNTASPPRGLGSWGKMVSAPARARSRRRPCPSQFCKSRHGGGSGSVEGTSHAGDAHRSSTSCRGFFDINNDSPARKTAPDDSSLSCYATLRRTGPAPWHLASRLSAAGARGGHMPTMTGCSFRVSLSNGARA